MKRRTRILLVSLLVILLGAFAWFVFRQKEPEYRGRSLTFWLEQEVDNGGLDPEAETAIRAMGADALPELLRMLGTKDTAIRRSLVALSQKLKWFAIRPRDQRLVLGFHGFLALGAAALPVAPDLIRYLDNPDPQVRGYAAFALGRIGSGAQAAIPKLIRNLSNGSTNIAGGFADLELRLTALALSEMGPAAQAAIPELTKLTNSPSSTGPGARAALIKIRGDAIEPYLELLKDSSNVTKWMGAMFTIRFLGTNGEPAVPVLITTLPQTNSQLSRMAMKALGQIRSRPDLSVPAIIPFLQSSNMMVRSDAIETIRAFGSTSNHLGVAEITQCLNDPDPVVGKRAARALKQIDPAAAVKAGVQ